MTGTRTRRRQEDLLRLLLTAALLAVILVLATAAVLRYLQVDELQLPDVRGMSFNEASRLLRERELVPVSYPDNVQGVPAGTVTSQTPPPGSTVRRGRNVSLGVNKPPEASQAPVLVGLTLQQASNTAAAMNLSLGTVEYAFSGQPAGRVIGQRPEAGERVRPGEGLRLVVSRGPEQATLSMPDLVGVRLDAARRQLERLGVRRIETVAVGVSLEAAGAVAAQIPKAGDPLSVSTPVRLGYNLSAREVVPVPDVAGKRPEEAERLLRGAGLKVGEIRYVQSDEATAGTVVEVSPRGFTLPGTPMVITVDAPMGSFDRLAHEAEAERPADGEPERAGEATLDEGGTRAQEPESGGRQIRVTFDPAALGVRSLLERDYDLRLVVSDEAGERTVIDRRVRAGEQVSAVVVVEGDGLLQTYINGVFFQAWRP